MELLEQRCMLASDWQNPLWNLDVDDDGTLSPLDALVIINKINAADPNLNLRQPVGNNPYLDVDADLTLSPLDVLQIINRINAGQNSVQVDMSLRSDSGQSSTDRITNDSVLVGQFTPLRGLTYTAKARINRGPVVTVTLDSNNKFIFNPNSAGAVADGDLVSKILIMASDGSVGPRHVPFTLNTTAPLITAAFKNDTGQSGTDRVTSDPTVSGSAIDDRQVVTLRAGFDSSQIQSYFDILTDLNADGSFTLSPTRLAQINAGQLSDGDWGWGPTWDSGLETKWTDWSLVWRTLPTVPVEDEGYYWNLSRYIHLNPCKGQQATVRYAGVLSLQHFRRLCP